jgi:hypothetical protein
MSDTPHDPACMAGKAARTPQSDPGLAHGDGSYECCIAVAVGDPSPPSLSLSFSRPRRGFLLRRLAG